MTDPRGGTLLITRTVIRHVHTRISEDYVLVVHDLADKDVGSWSELLTTKLPMVVNLLGVNQYVTRFWCC